MSNVNKSYTSDEKVDVEHYIGEWSHTLYALMF